MELVINLEFSESLNEFRHNLIDAPQGDFKTIAEDIEYSEARRFIDWVRERITRPLSLYEVMVSYDDFLENNQ